MLERIIKIERLDNEEKKTILQVIDSLLREMLRQKSPMQLSEYKEYLL